MTEISFDLSDDEFSAMMEQVTNDVEWSEAQWNKLIDTICLPVLAYWLVSALIASEVVLGETPADEP